MFEELEKSIKYNAECNQRLHSQMDHVETHLYRLRDHLISTQNLLISTFVILLISLFLNIAAVYYGVHSSNLTAVNQIHIEHVEKQLDEIRVRK